MMPIIDNSKLKFTDSENKFTVYTNHTGVSMSLFDLRLIFGVLEPQDEPGKTEVTVVKQGSVLMSPLHAKLLCKNIQANIEVYESQFGEIKTPPEQPPAPAKK